MDKMLLRLFLVLFLQPLAEASCIHRRKIVQSFNPRRNASSASTPLQVGNGNFAFGVDITGLQTFRPFATMSTWGWHNFSLPTTPGQTSVEDYTGLDWWTHGRLVNYAQPNPAQNDISNWLRENPHRLNLGNIGFSFNGARVEESQLEQKSQVLDMWEGKISSSFVYKGSLVQVETSVHPESDVVGIEVKSDLLSSAALGIFFDFPYPTREKFDAPFVGIWNATDSHSTRLLESSSSQATIRHTLGNDTYVLVATWEGEGSVSGPGSNSHRYTLSVPGSKTLKLTAAFSQIQGSQSLKYDGVVSGSKAWWRNYWTDGAFIDLSAAQSPQAAELQKRIILSQYLVTINGASSYPPQESGLVNNGWYGKFHMEMCLWHSLHFARWNHFPLMWRSMPNTYHQFLESSRERARLQGYKGARWGKMTDPNTGRSSPGEINSLLIWQQPHPMYYAEVEYRSFPNDTTLFRWDEVLTATADFMASYAWLNKTTGVYDLGPPIYPVSENTNPNVTVNPTFELAYWRFGLDVAIRWKERQGFASPKEWATVRDKLAPLPVVDGTYATYEGIPGMWTNNATTFDHPAMSGIYGLLPPPSRGAPLNETVLRNTAARIKQLWALDQSYGWDFAMLAMNSVRLGDPEQAVAYLLHPVFQFDDAGYPVGGSRVPTPYFPNSASLLLAAAMMAGGWDGEPGAHFPEGWKVTVEGFVPGL